MNVNKKNFVRGNRKVFCHHCGRKIRGSEKFCPYCGEKVNTAIQKKNYLLKILLAAVLFLSIVCISICALLYFKKMKNSSMLSFNVREQLEAASKEAITVKQLEIEMDSEMKGTATLLIKMPNYVELFQEAIKTENPENYTLKALKSGKYDTVEYQSSALITVEDGKEIIHSEEVVKKLLEKSLVEAINALSEVTNEKDN